MRSDSDTIRVAAPQTACSEAPQYARGDSLKRTLSTATIEIRPRDVLRCHQCQLVQFRTSSNLCRKCAHPLALPPRFETAPLGGLNGAGGRVNGNSHFAVNRALDGSGLQPRGKTARELTIGRKLRELREERHLTQQEMAGRAGVPRTYISRIENARLLPGPVMLQRIADALSVAILDLLPQTRNGIGAPDLADENYWASFVSYFSQLRPGDMAAVVTHVREMTEADQLPSMMPAYAAQ